MLSSARRREETPEPRILRLRHLSQANLLDPIQHVQSDPNSRTAHHGPRLHADDMESPCEHIRALPRYKK